MSGNRIPFKQDHAETGTSQSIGDRATDYSSPNHSNAPPN